MTMDIPQGTFSECIKTGVFFSIDNDDRVFTGDLYYDFALREFQLRGIPSFEGRMRHVFEADFKGPVLIDLFLKSVIDKGPNSDGKYSVVKFRLAKVSGALGAHIEEWHGDRTVMQAIDEFWEFSPSLAWYKS